MEPCKSVYVFIQSFIVLNNNYYNPSPLENEYNIPLHEVNEERINNNTQSMNRSGDPINPPKSIEFSACLLVKDENHNLPVSSNDIFFKWKVPQKYSDNIETFV